MRQEFFASLLAGFRLANDLDIRLVAEQQAIACPNHGMFIDQDCPEIVSHGVLVMMPAQG